MTVTVFLLSPFGKGHAACRVRKVRPAHGGAVHRPVIDGLCPICPAGALNGKDIPSAVRHPKDAIIGRIQAKALALGAIDHRAVRSPGISAGIVEDALRQSACGGGKRAVFAVSPLVAV